MALPPAPDVEVTAELRTAQAESVRFSATIPGAGVQGTASVTSCVDDAVSWQVPGHDAVVSFATTSAATACPETDPLNGQFPSWADAADLPEGAVEIALPGVPVAHRFSLVYTECTNSCTDYDRELALLELDGATVLASSTGMDADAFDRVLASVRQRP